VSETVKLTIPAKADYLVLCRLVLSGIAMQTPMSDIELADLKLAVTEVCGNAVQHAATAAPGVVRVVYRVEPDAIEVAVEDEGAGAPPSRKSTRQPSSKVLSRAAWAWRS
jgi:serine/threonine-protein kinase RsbW